MKYVMLFEEFQAGPNLTPKPVGEVEVEFLDKMGTDGAPAMWKQVPDVKMSGPVPAGMGAMYYTFKWTTTTGALAIINYLKNNGWTEDFGMEPETCFPELYMSDDELGYQKHVDGVEDPNGYRFDGDEDDDVSPEMKDIFRRFSPQKVNTQVLANITKKSNLN